MLKESRNNLLKIRNSTLPSVAAGRFFSQKEKAEADATVAIYLLNCVVTASMSYGPKPN